MHLLTFLLILEAAIAGHTHCLLDTLRAYSPPIKTCYPHQRQEYEQLTTGESTGPLCVAVLTGYPEVDNRFHLLRRLLRSLIDDFRIPRSHLHVFCQGKCLEALNSSFPATYHHLNNAVNRSSYRGFVISENYRLLLAEVFGGTLRYNYCAILEDDLLLSSDALNYLRAGRTLMASDETVFTVSLYNDNAYPWCASDQGFFRRVDHFSGLGFLMSRALYRSHVLPAWTDTRVWDNLFQLIVSQYNMVSVQPEVNRVLHAINLHVTSLQAPWLSYNKYESQAVNTETKGSFPYDLAPLRKDNYDKFIADYIRHATLIEYMEDADFFNSSDKLVHSSADIGGLMTSHHLAGIGLGNVVRGSYSNTVFLRVYGVHTLVVEQDSVFFSLVSAKPLWRLNEYVVDSSLSRHHLGPLYELRRRYVIALSAPDVAESCVSVCGKRSRSCSVTGLWLLATDCAVLRTLVKECRSCSQDTLSLLQIRTPVVVEHSLDCRIGSRHFLSCLTPSSPSNRSICACV